MHRALGRLLALLFVVVAPLGSSSTPTLLTGEGVRFVDPEPFVGFETYVVTIPTPFDVATVGSHVEIHGTLPARPA